MSFWNQCWHNETSHPDEMGDAICLTCGAKVRTTLTPAGLMDTFDSMLRQGYGGRRHSKRCVLLEDRSWLCAEECEMRRPAA